MSSAGIGDAGAGLLATIAQNFGPVCVRMVRRAYRVLGAGPVVAGGCGVGRSTRRRGGHPCPGVHTRAACHARRARQTIRRIHVTTADAVMDELARVCALTTAQVRREAMLIELGLDSIRGVEFLIALESQFG